MIIQPRQGDRLGSIGRAPEPTVDDLLRAAVAEGGAVGDTAQRLLDPKKSFFSTMTDATMKTLNGFVDTIQTPMYAVAGLLDPTRTVAETVRDRVSPGDVLMPDAPLKEASFYEKAGYQVAKFGVDTLLDPLTYLTFGASRGAVGISKGASAFAGPELAKQLGTKEGMRVYLSEAGEELADNYFKAQSSGLRQTFLKNERVKMVNKGFEPDEITRRLADLDNETSDYMIKNILDAPLDKKQATQAVLNMLESDRMKHLVPEMIDKGGVKFFGKSILSGQRIRAVKSVLPGTTALDKAMEPVRGYFGNIFSTKYANGQRLTDEFLETQDKWKNIYEAHRDRLSIHGARLKQQLKLTDNEWEFVTAAAEYGFKPGDKKADDVWRLLHESDPVNGTISEDVWRGVTQVKKMQNLSRDRLVAAGIPVPDQPNYMPHLLVKEKVTNVPFKPSILKQTTNRTKFAAFSAFKTADGERIPVKFLDKPDADGNIKVLKMVDGEEVEDTVSLVKGSSQYMDSEGNVMERIRGSVQEARRFGIDFEENALVASLLASDDAIRVSTAKHFIKEVSEKYGHPASKAPVGSVPISKTGFKYEGQDIAKWMTDTAGEPLYFHPAIAKNIEDFTTNMSMDKGTESVLKAYDSLQNYFKAAVTSIFPAFHGRNALSNVFLAYNKIGVEALNPVSHNAAANILGLERKTKELQRRIIKGKSTDGEMAELMSKVMFKDKTGYEWTWGELRKEIIDNVVAFHHKNLGQTDQLKFGTSEVAEAAKKMFPKTKRGKAMQKAAPFNPFNEDNMLFQGGFKIGQTIEDYSRTLLFMSHLKKVGDPIEAARVTKLALFDYSNLTKFEKSFMRRIVPFYSFSRKNLELQINTLMTTPGRTAQQIRAVQSLGDFFGEGELTEEERAKLPDWAQGGYDVVSKREGSNITLLRTLGTPLEELFNRADPQQNLGMVSPLIKAPIEFMAGYSFFHGRPISEVTQADAYQFAPDHIKKWIGYTEVKYTDSAGVEQTYHTSFAPWRMYTINNLQPVGRFFSEVNRIEKAPDSASKMNALMFGFGTREFNLEREEMKRIKENEEALQSLLEQAGLGYTFNRYVPETTQEIGSI